MASLTLRPPALLQIQIASHTNIITSHITCLSAFLSSLLHYSFSAPLCSSFPLFLHQPWLSLSNPFIPTRHLLFFHPSLLSFVSRYLSLPFLVCLSVWLCFFSGEEERRVERIHPSPHWSHPLSPLSVALWAPLIPPKAFSSCQKVK